VLKKEGKGVRNGRAGGQRAASNKKGLQVVLGTITGTLQPVSHIFLRKETNKNVGPIIIIIIIAFCDKEFQYLEMIFIESC
jgi:hypothetical protein